MAADTKPRRQTRVLAKPMSQGGVMRAAGEEVELRDDQIARLEAEGYLAPAPADGPGRGKRPATEGD